MAKSSISSGKLLKTRLKLLAVAVVATFLFALFGTPESLKPPSKFHRWINEQASVPQPGTNLRRLDPSSIFSMITRAPDGSLTRLIISAEKYPQQTQRLVELAHESGLFTDEKSEELKKAVDSITPIEQLSWEGHILFEVDGAGLVFRRAVNKGEISDNIAAQNLVRLFRFYADGGMASVYPPKTE